MTAKREASLRMTARREPFAQNDNWCGTLAHMDSAVYIMTNRHRTVLYIGVTSNLKKRIADHRAGVHPSSFTKKYNVDRLVYFEMGRDIRSSIAREKQLKRWRREKKVALIEAMNPEWNDLSD
jgi:putative endonuclease